jgi:hypothetical protein
MAQDVAAAVGKLARELKSHRRLAGDSGFIAHHSAQLDQCQITQEVVRRRLEEGDRCVKENAEQLVRARAVLASLKEQRDAVKRLKDLTFESLPGTRLQAPVSPFQPSEPSSIRAPSDKSASRASSPAASLRQPLAAIQAPVHSGTTDHAYGVHLSTPKCSLSQGSTQAPTTGSVVVGHGTGTVCWCQRNSTSVCRSKELAVLLQALCTHTTAAYPSFAGASPCII